MEPELAIAETGTAVNAPRVMPVLGLLVLAGREGMQAGAISRAFTDPPGTLARAVRVNALLKELAAAGRVRRSRRTEPSDWYHRTPCYRWYITPAGEQWWHSGGRAGQWLRARRRETERAANADRRRDSWEQAAQQAPRLAAAARESGCIAERDRAIGAMREAGLSYQLIGEQFGISRERVRQVLNGSRAWCPCGCSGPRPAGRGRLARYQLYTEGSEWN